MAGRHHALPIAEQPLPDPLAERMIALLTAPMLVAAILAMAWMCVRLSTG